LLRDAIACVLSWRAKPNPHPTQKNKQTIAAYYVETLKLDKKYKIRIAGDSQSSDHALCLGYKPDARWAKSVKLLHTPVRGGGGACGVVVLGVFGRGRAAV
jgi:hypothetical protein